MPYLILMNKQGVGVCQEEEEETRVCQQNLSGERDRKRDWRTYVLWGTSILSAVKSGKETFPITVDCLLQVINWLLSDE